MSKLFSRISGFFSSRTLVGVDKAGNRYFTRKEEIDGIMKEKRWAVFKGEEDPTSIPVEWICWLNGQRKKEMIELEARRKLIRQNVARMCYLYNDATILFHHLRYFLVFKKEEEERRAKEGSSRKIVNAGKVGGPDLKRFIQQFPTASEGKKLEEESNVMEKARTREAEADIANDGESLPTSSEPTGSGATFRPAAWQPPT